MVKIHKSQKQLNRHEIPELPFEFLAYLMSLPIKQRAAALDAYCKARKRNKSVELKGNK